MSKQSIQKTEAVVTDTQKYVEAGFERMAFLLSKKLPAPILGQVFAMVNKWQKLIKDNYRERAREQIIELLKDQGTPDPETTKITLEAGSIVLSMHANRTGTDPAALQKLLRAKEMDPASWMTPTISYKVDQDKLELLIAKKKLTKAEVESCAYSESWVVNDPLPSGAIHGDFNE